MGGQVLELQSEKDQRIGREQGREQILSLNHILISQKRYSDLDKASLDPDYCQQLLEEFNLLSDTDE